MVSRDEGVRGTKGGRSWARRVCTCQPLCIFLSPAVGGPREEGEYGMTGKARDDPESFRTNSELVLVSQWHGPWKLENATYAGDISNIKPWLYIFCHQGHLGIIEGFQCSLWING